ncbi:MAG: sodium:alanine symporter family protein, partial [Candidatus Thiodiazotropha sp. 6PDIVS]
MDSIQKLIEGLNGIVWGPVMLVLILGTGLFLMIGLKLMPLARLRYGFKMLWAG